MIVAMKCIFYIRLKTPKRGLLGQNNVSNWAVLLFPNFLWLWHALITSCRCISPSEDLQKLVQSPHSIQPVTKLCLAYICERNDYPQKFQNRICTIILVLKVPMTQHTGYILHPFSPLQTPNSISYNPVLSIYSSPPK